jgi:hypothetical protein
MIRYIFVNAPYFNALRVESEERNATGTLTGTQGGLQHLLYGKPTIIRDPTLRIARPSGIIGQMFTDVDHISNELNPAFRALRRRNIFRLNHNSQTIYCHADVCTVCAYTVDSSHKAMY